MSEIKDVIIRNGHEQSRISHKVFKIGESESDVIKDIYLNAIVSEDNLNYLINNLDLEVDDITKINTVRKLKKRIKNSKSDGNYTFYDVVGAFKDMPAMDVIINELLSKGIVKQQYKLVSNGKTEREKQIITYDNCYGCCSDISLFKARIEDLPLIVSYNNYGEIELNAHIVSGYSKSFKFDDITIPNIVNDDNKRNKAASKRILNKIFLKGKKLELSNDDNYYNYLVNINEDMMANSIAHDLAYYFSIIEAKGFPENCYFEMNDSYGDKKVIGSRLLEHLFLFAKITNTNGDEYESFLINGTDKRHNKKSEENKNHRFLNENIYDLLCAVSFYNLAEIKATSDECNSFDDLLQKLKESINESNRRHKEIEDKVLLESLSDKDVMNIFEVSNNCKQIEQEYLNKLIETTQQLKDRFNTPLDMINVLNNTKK